MIDTKQLRIGNVIGRMVCRPPDWNKAVALEFLTPSLAVFLFKNEEDVLSTFVPVPITPELLEICGFVDHAGNGWGSRLQLNSTDELAWYKQDNSLKYQTQGSGFSRDFSIKYLHQLQNLFFALTGDELKINL